MSSRGTKEIDVGALKAIVNRARAAALTEEEAELLGAAVDTLAVLTAELDSKRASVERLRRLLFGAKTEKTSEVLGDGASPEAEPAAGSTDGAAPQSAPAARAKVKGHGRHAASDYVGATVVSVPHPALKAGDRCTRCPKGKLHPLKEPSSLIRVTGMAPLQAHRFDCERLRCGACGEVFTAPPPAGVGTKKHDESAIAMIGVMRYGTGLPWNRLAKLQAAFGVPVPAATQWELVSAGALALLPAYRELVRAAAQAPKLFNDDTTMKVLEVGAAWREQEAADNGGDPDRTGTFTTGIVAQGEHAIGLFVTGPQHAGENLNDLLARRESSLGPPIQMCDALSRNVPGDFATIETNCLAHARRHFVDVTSRFPDECRFVLETLREVYRNDAKTRGMSDDERLRFNQEHSGPLMAKLDEWMRLALEEKRVEPNSALGQAIAYMQKHWPKLTRFLEQPGAPLDNNICERALKRAILHRKNSLFYKTLNGAFVGDLWMSLIQTAELNRVPPFDYLVALLTHPAELKASPADWMPWSYTAALEKLRLSTGPPG